MSAAKRKRNRQKGPDPKAARRAARQREREEAQRQRKARQADEKFQLHRVNELSSKRKKADERDWVELEKAFPDKERVVCLDCEAEHVSEGLLEWDERRDPEHKNFALACSRAVCPSCGHQGVRYDVVTLSELYERRTAGYDAEEEPKGGRWRDRVIQRRIEWGFKWHDEHMPGQTYPMHVRGHTPPVADILKEGGSQHPGEIAKRLRRRQHPDLDPVERELRREESQAKRLIRENANDGPGAWAMRRAAEAWMPQLQELHDLPGIEHQLAGTEWFVGVIGRAVDRFPEPLDDTVDVFQALLDDYLGLYEAALAQMPLEKVLRTPSVDVLREVWMARFTDGHFPGYLEYRERSRKRIRAIAAAA